MQRKAVSLAISTLVIGGTLTVGAATAGTRAETTVTIKANGGDYYGFVSSTWPKRCAKDRKIVLFEQIGAVQNPSVDQRVASDTASRQGDRYRWDTGNTGQYGTFYARAGRTPSCKADNSRSITTTP